MSIDYNNSWLGTDNVDMITIEKDFYAQGEVEIGMTRIDHTTVSNSGPIAHIQLTIKDDVLKSISRRLNFNIKDVRLIDSVGNESPVTPEASSVLIEKMTTGIEQIENFGTIDFDIYPNPITNNRFNISMHGVEGDVAISIYNALGQLVKQEQHNAQDRLEIDFEAVPGVYYVQLSNDNGVVGVRKLTVY